MEYLERLIQKLLYDDKFPLIPYINEVSEEDKFIFNFFKNLNSEIIVTELFKNTTNKDVILKCFKIIMHFKDKITLNNNNITFVDYELFRNIIHLIDEISIDKLNKIYYKEILINNHSVANMDELLNFVMIADFDIYFEYTSKHRLDVIKKIFEFNKEKVFLWLNGHSNKYTELKKLNQPDFIIKNMNGRLDVNDDTLKYFFEICPIEINVFKELKKTLGLEIVYKYAGHMLHIDFMFELVETFDDLVFVFNIIKYNLSDVEYILVKLKNKFPHMYENFNSLMFIKNDFNNK